MRKSRLQTKARPPSMQPAEEGAESLGSRRHAVFKKKYDESLAAFSQWDTAQAGTDKQLYQAIGRLAEFAAVVGNNHGGLAEFAAEKGVKATKASSIYTVITKLVVTTDRRKASKYATVLHLAAREGVETKAAAVVEFIQREGGIEACLRRMREMARENKSSTRQGRPSKFSQAIRYITEIQRSQAPAALRRDPISQDYVLIVGMRGEDGTLNLLHQPVTDEAIVRKAIATLKPNEEK